MNENYPYYGQTQQQQPQQPYINPQYQYLSQMRQGLNRAENPYYMPQAPVSTQNYIKGRPVVSIEEARASQIDLDGSLYVFTDLGNKKIYTKQINPDGTASLNTYVLASENPDMTKQEYVTKEDFKKTLAQLKEYLGAAAAQKQPINFDF